MPSILLFRALAMTPMTSSPPGATWGAGRKEVSPPAGEAMLTAAPQLPQNFVVLEIAPPQMPQNLPAVGAAGAGAGAGTLVATTADPQMPQNFSNPLTGLPQEEQT